ncbi:hypothetical protein TNCV_3167741 [Trichonephila clavipes]|uniref:Uncharacterized protein n=1 Tax=Trichonephila clavipes TaxID=2585209 RepID=A0A8X6UWZ9_TRICX|nr:hypothetical protein TNCV_3167741 [Trichonephila clavipes]
MQGRKYHSCELGCKETEERNRNSNKLMGKKTFYLKTVQKQVLEITTRSPVADLTAVVAWDSLCFGRFMACHLSSRQLQILERGGLQLK